MRMMSVIISSPDIPVKFGPLRQIFGGFFGRFHDAAAFTRHVSLCVEGYRRGAETQHRTSGCDISLYHLHFLGFEGATADKQNSQTGVFEDLQVFEIVPSFALHFRHAQRKIAVNVFQCQIVRKLRQALIGVIFAFGSKKCNAFAPVAGESELFRSGKIGGDNRGTDMRLNIFYHQVETGEVVNKRRFFGIIHHVGHVAHQDDVHAHTLHRPQSE